MPRDLRDFINNLSENAPSEIVEIDKEVDPTWEVTSIARKLQSEGQFPLLLFNNVFGSSHRLVTNVHATRTKLAYGLESPEVAPRDLLQRYIELTGKPAKPILVDNKDAPVKQNIKTGKDVDLTELPLVQHNELDNGLYIDAGILWVFDKETQTYNAGIYRHQLHEPNLLGVYAGAGQHLAHLMRSAERENTPLEVAITVGTHPYLTIGSTTRIDREADELDAISGLINEAVGSPMQTVQCETIDLQIPANSEFVIEGKILPNVLRTEGPFGEYPWTYGPSRTNRVIEVTAICHRDDPIHETIFAAHPDHNLCGVLGVERQLYERVNRVSRVREVRMPMHGCCRFTGFVSINKEVDGEGKYAVLAALAADHFLKNVVVVDEDIDVFDDNEVLWALWSRTHMDRDAVIIPHSFADPLVPSTYTADQLETRRTDWDEQIVDQAYLPNPDTLDTKFGVNATKPVTTQWPKRPEPPEVWKDLDLSEYIDGWTN